MTRIGVDAYLGHERAMRYHKNGVSAQYRARNISHPSPNGNQNCPKESWISEIHLKIGVLEVIWKLEF